MNAGWDKDMYGLAFPWDRACIVYLHWNLDAYIQLMLQTIMHEVGHCYGLQHCSDNWCFMYGEPSSLACRYCSSCSENLMANRDCLLKPVPWMKTETNGYFYIPDTSPNMLIVRSWFDNDEMVGDQTGSSYYPDGEVDSLDLNLIAAKYDSSEGDAG